ncbi:tRNA lysidine(34) synthetase TilS [Brevibacillus dissolubilis]|uniref:tRNA lysidine(34) synthetase TilS n=1 Tax=Brevibacillus dissolubilis TaxID=1844116 RepID=UPI001116D342|nr:tRNA lysidine(34) synthetase TilS [Brevibacillus dissolubilis]
MLLRVQKRIKETNMLTHGESIVVGVSGGTDSTALLHILSALNQQYKYGWQIHVVHLNHCFRGEESDGDAAYVEDLCHTVGVRCWSFRRDVPAYMRETGLGSQEASRQIRYGLYQQVAEETGSTKVVLAHHADDQVETILMRILRGTGIHGLSGMPERRWLVDDRVELVRPLLTVSRRDLEAYCHEVGLTPREDSSNQSRKYQRNKLRLDLIPLMEELNPRYREHILKLSRLAQADDAYLMEETKRVAGQVILSQDAEKIILDRKKFQTCDLALQSRMITLILSYLSNGMEWSSQHVEAVLHVIGQENPSAAVHLANQVVVERMYEHIHISKEATFEQVQPFALPLILPGTTWIGQNGTVIHASYLDRAPHWHGFTANQAVFDADQLEEMLHVRSRRPGDRITLSGGTQKLKELLIDAKVPKQARDRIPLILAGDVIIWVPGVRRSAHAQVSDRTTRFLYIEVEFREEWQEVHHA